MINTMTINGVNAVISYDSDIDMSGPCSQYGLLVYPGNSVGDAADKIVGYRTGKAR